MTCTAYPPISRQWLVGEEDEARFAWCRVHEHLLIRGRTASSVDLALIELRGNIDAESVSALARVFDELIGTGATSLSVDMSAIESVDSAGARAFALIANALETRGGRFRLRNVPSSAARLLRTTGLGRLLIASGASAGGALRARR
jgi:anti-anti-sigma factor